MREFNALLTSNDNHDNQDNHAGKQAYAHLHVFPPHLLAHAICAPTEPLGRYGQVVGLVLQRVEAFTTLRDLVDVLAHHADGVVDLLVKKKKEESEDGVCVAC